jgi:hypothetical protein
MLNAHSFLVNHVTEQINGRQPSEILLLDVEERAREHVPI